MDFLTDSPKTTTKSSRRRGRGIGSCAGGHFTGRGGKGDKVRGKTKLTFDGTKIKKGWIKRTPFLRGKHLNESYITVFTFGLNQIDKWFKVNDSVTPSALVKKAGFSSRQGHRGIKILSNGKLTKVLTFKGLTFSKSAKEQIISAGGKIEA